MAVIIELWISVILGNEKIVSLQDIRWEIRWAVRIKSDITSLDLMQSEILESLDDNHFMYEVHIKEALRTLCFCLIVLPRILLTVLKIFLELLPQALRFCS